VGTEAAAMIYRVLARLMILIHTAYVAFVVFGSVVVLRWPKLMWVHIAAVVWGFATLAFDLGCPLTPWEKGFWKRGGVEPYPEGFLQHHILRGWSSDKHSHRNHAILGTAALVFNAIVYGIVLSR
jgi:hypothetical protein